MELLATILIIVGILVGLAGHVMFLAAANRVSTGWLIGCLFIFVWPFFCFSHFSVAWKPLVVFLAGLLIAGLGTVLQGAAY